ncbi:UNVERIFIED_CONTAM: ATP-citrate synthase subunit alpha chain protein 1 [Sesamum radiatum]|uniref:ATP-citrate synthase subunit alpha chain protein 1 n=1 Tax=Sesamum radiatum TaxID=300843 RepID=A0AAW2MZQ4_SESRA
MGNRRSFSGKASQFLARPFWYILRPPALTISVHLCSVKVGGDKHFNPGTLQANNSVANYPGTKRKAKLKAARMHLYVRRGGPNYQKGLARMRSLAEEIGIPIEVYGPEATMTGICKQAIECISAAA